MDEMNELKPCPFCGTQAVLGRGDFYMCPNGECQIFGVKFSRSDAWNTRPIEDDLHARAEKAERFLQLLVEAQSMGWLERTYAINALVDEWREWAKK